MTRGKKIKNFKNFFHSQNEKVEKVTSEKDGKMWEKMNKEDNIYPKIQRGKKKVHMNFTKAKVLTIKQGDKKATPSEKQVMSGRKLEDIILCRIHRPKE